MDATGVDGVDGWCSVVKILRRHISSFQGGGFFGWVDVATVMGVLRLPI